MKKLFIIGLALFLISSISKAQDTMYIHQQGSVISKAAINKIDSVIFYADTMITVDGSIITKIAISKIDSVIFYADTITSNGCSKVTDVDGNTYNAVMIGNQCWLAKNLNTGIRINIGNYQIDNNIIEKYCYGNYISSCNTYGGLYQWDEMMQYNPSDNGTIGTTQGICPNGWHIPTDAEWATLGNFLIDNGYGYQGSGNDIGKSMATTSGWNMSSIAGTVGCDQSSNNSSGFTALPGGYCNNYNGTSNNINGLGYWWSATRGQPSYYAWCCFLNSNYSVLYKRKNSIHKANGISVRCIKD